MKSISTEMRAALAAVLLQVIAAEAASANGNLSPFVHTPLSMYAVPVSKAPVTSAAFSTAAIKPSAVNQLPGPSIHQLPTFSMQTPSQTHTTTSSLNLQSNVFQVAPNNTVISPVTVPHIVSPIVNTHMVSVPTVVQPATNNTPIASPNIVVQTSNMTRQATLPAIPILVQPATNSTPTASPNIVVQTSNTTKPATLPSIPILVQPATNSTPTASPNIVVQTNSTTKPATLPAIPIVVQPATNSTPTASPNIVVQTSNTTRRAMLPAFWAQAGGQDALTSPMQPIAEVFHSTAATGSPSAAVNNGSLEFSKTSTTESTLQEAVGNVQGMQANLVTSSRALSDNLRSSDRVGNETESANAEDLGANRAQKASVESLSVVGTLLPMPQFMAPVAGVNPAVPAGPGHEASPGPGKAFQVLKAGESRKKVNKSSKRRSKAFYEKKLKVLLQDLREALGKKDQEKAHTIVRKIAAVLMSIGEKQAVLETLLKEIYAESEEKWTVRASPTRRGSVVYLRNFDASKRNPRKGDVEIRIEFDRTRTTGRISKFDGKGWVPTQPYPPYLDKELQTVLSLTSDGKYKEAETKILAIGRILSRWYKGRPKAGKDAVRVLESLFPKARVLAQKLEEVTYEDGYWKLTFSAEKRSAWDDAGVKTIEIWFPRVGKDGKQKRPYIYLRTYEGNKEPLGAAVSD